MRVHAAAHVAAVPSCQTLRSHAPVSRERGAGETASFNFGEVAVWQPALSRAASTPILQRQPEDPNGEGGTAPAADPETPAQPADPETPAEPGDNGETGNAGGGLIVEDSVTDPAPEQMRKSDFLAQLGPAVTSAAAGASGEQGSAGSKAEFDKRLANYAAQDATVLESDIRRYAAGASGATTANDYIPSVVDAVREAAASGNTPTPAADSDAPRDSGPDLGLPLFKRSGPGPAAASPRAIRRQLGPGAAVEAGVRSRMESAFGSDFSRVRVHTDASAAKLASSLKARAFTVGEHVAFASHQYRPGTLTGDALLAHELAHVVQQEGSAEAPQTQSVNSDRDALEQEADQSAIGAVASLWAGTKDLLGMLAQNSMGALKSGLRLSRCCTQHTCEKKTLKTIAIDVFEFPGRALDPDKEVAGASSIWRAGAGIQFSATKHAISEADAQSLIGKEASEKGKAAKDLSLQYEFYPFLAGSGDEMDALHSRHNSTKGSMSAFFVPDMHGIGSHSAVDSEPGVRIAYIAQGKAGCADGYTLAHELGHLLIDPAKSVKGHSFDSPLMNSLGCSDGIDCDECGIARGT